jgi:hypothetical protein
MLVGLSPAAAPTIKSESAAISARYPNLSTFHVPAKAAGRGGLSPYRTAAYFGQITAKFPQD